MMLWALLAGAVALSALGFICGLTALLWAASYETAWFAWLDRLEEAFGHGYRAGRRDR